MNNVVFASLNDTPGQSTFEMNNLIVNGIAFWDLNMVGGTISFQNAQGCTQIISDFILLSDVRLTRCATLPTDPPEMPEPTSLTMTATGLIGLFTLYRRKKRASQTA